MREILFRGKRKDRTVPEWVEGGIVHQTDHYGSKCDCWFIIEGDTTLDYGVGFPWEVFPETIGQLTGLTDKNGKQIFEGDIVRFTNRCMNDDPAYGECVWDTDESAFRFDCGFDLCKWNQEIEDVEVIGNIHDNPELIGGGGE